ncbi:MAG: hydrogenase 4 subunit F [Nitrososphaerota archaeon]|nr:hydrogenase 4 subunit F [Nitrososphaerota archaeon]MDG6967628.1 hydrogenase 4 subunit F [Nitrososphaerota archaeon]MDG6979343.1 hydrogenase 4 subunit F [Nitrososphaerota archaeon]
MGALPSGWDLLMVTVLLTPISAAVLVGASRRVRLAEVATVVSAALVAIQAAGLMAGVVAEARLAAFGDFFSLDALGALILIPIAGVGLVTALYSVNYMRRQHERGIVDDRHLVRYYAGFNVFMLTMLVVPLANNTGLMWVAIEATTLVSVFLIMLYTTEGAIEAAWKYLIVATVGLSLALFGIVLFSYALSQASPSAASSGTAMDWTLMATYARSLDPAVVRVAYVFVLVGLGTKAGLAPMHTWLPDAHGEAPTPMSALLSGVLLNCAIYGILRFNIVASSTLGRGFPDALLIGLGLLSMGVAACSIYFSRDMKRMLAYSSVEHMGIISIAVGFGGLGLFAALLHIINHATAKPLMFFASGKVSQRYDTKVMADIRGVVRTMPLTAMLMLIGGLAMAGLPPFNIFLSELLVLTAGFGSGQIVATTLMMLFLALVFAGFLRHLVSMSFGSPKATGRVVPDLPLAGHGDSGPLAIVPMAILAVVVVVLGFYVPQPLQTLVHAAARVLGQGSTP